MYWDSNKGAGGIAWVDFSTGQWTGLHSRREPELWQWLVKINPREILLPQGKKVPPQYGELSGQVTSVQPGAYFDTSSSENKIVELQGTADLASLDLVDKPELVRSCGALLTYLEHTQKGDLGHLGEFKPLNLGKHLLLDEVTERNLEIFRRLDGKGGKGTLWKVLDRTMTPMGGRLLEARLRQPWRDISPIEKNLQCVSFLFERDQLRSGLRQALDSVYDLERLSTRVFLGRAIPKDFVALRQSLPMLPKLQALLTNENVETAPALRKLLRKWDNMEDLSTLLSAALVDSPPPVITDGGLFQKGYDSQLDEFIELNEHGEDKLKALHEKESAESSIPKLKLGYNKVFGYYFEISKVYQGKSLNILSGDRPWLTVSATSLLGSRSLKTRLFRPLKNARRLSTSFFRHCVNALRRHGVVFCLWLMWLPHLIIGRDWQNRPESMNGVVLNCTTVWRSKLKRVVIRLLRTPWERLIIFPATSPWTRIGVFF